MIDVLSVENMRKSDAHTIASKTSGRELMLRAAKGVFDAVSFVAPVAIVCGTGNNAGDGYALAGLLNDAGICCEIIICKEKFSEDGKYYYDDCVQRKISVRRWTSDTDLSTYKTVVDCLLGTGFSGPVRDDVKEIIEAINRSGSYVVSVDINSGLNGDSGMGDTCVVSDITVSIGGFKPGHFLNRAKDVMKDKVNVDIGIEPVDKTYKLVTSDDIRNIMPKRLNHSNKGTYGYVALLGGSLRYSGAIRLAYMAGAAMRSGAGVVKAAVPRSLVHDVAPHILESTLFPLSDNDGSMVFVDREIKELVSNVKSVAFGMGAGVTEETEKILKYILSEYKGRLIIDADGLNIVAKAGAGALRESEAQIVLTPHIKEFSRLTGLTVEEILANPIVHAAGYARKTGTVILLKGPSTVVTDGEEVYMIDRGCPGMATAGSGDVLSGILAATTAYIDDILKAVVTGAYINGLAGEIAERENTAVSMVAGDTVSSIAAAVREICS